MTGPPRGGAVGSGGSLRVRLGAIRNAGALSWLLGAAALVALTLWSGAGLVGAAVAGIGWGILAIIAIRLVTVAIAGAGWWLLFPAAMRPGLGGCLLLRFVREAANAMLPVAQIGGDVVGARLLTFRGVAAPLATASVIVDVMVQAATLFAFALVGLVVLFVVAGDGTLVRFTATGLAMAAPALGGFCVAQSRGGHRLLQGLLRKLPGRAPSRLLHALDQLYQNLTVIHADRRSLVSSSVVHMIGWLVGVAEVYVALGLLGYPAAWTEALVIESLMHAVRGAAFAVPGALGAQEGGLIVLCALFGIPPGHAVALSLAKRSADLALGVPGLLAWQWLEGRRLLRRGGAAPATPAPSVCTDP
jgi:putative membrane protein